MFVPGKACKGQTLAYYENQVTYGCNKCYDTGLRAQYYKSFVRNLQTLVVS